MPKIKIMKIDLRSDTVSQATKAMLEAMFTAKVGDDVFEEDPTMMALESKAAKMFSVEAALFCPSGTMTNQIAIKVHTNPGDEVICDKTAHVYIHEGGGIGFHSGCSIRLLDGIRGQFTAEEVNENINAENVHHPVTKLVSIENTSNKGGGSIWNFGEIEKIRKVCTENELKLHLDGARLFNALVETKISQQQYGEVFDSISICLSKGLGAPVGSLLLGNKAFIKQARRFRRMMGGGMRQAGYLAAAGIYALDNNIQRLKDDHLRAKDIGNLMGRLAFVEEVLPVETNIVMFRLMDSMPSEKFMGMLAENGVFVVPFGKQTIRAVTHLNITDDHMERLKNVLNRLF